MMVLGVDTGGTFTDFVLLQHGVLRFHKVLSTPENPALAILQGMEELAVDGRGLSLIHGSTVATNAILERKGVRTALITNEGLEDLLTIGRQTRAELYDLTPPAPRPWLTAADCFGIAGRIDADGREIAALAPEQLAFLAHQLADYDAIAVSLLFSFLNPQHEQQLAAALPAHAFLSLSHIVLPEVKEYERASTTFLNAYVGPLVQRYLRHLQQMLQAKGSMSLRIMHSAGGGMSPDEAGNHAVRLALSGPAGGLVAAQQVGEQLHTPRLMSFDMGGTSTDVALFDGQPALSHEAELAGLPVATPMLDIHTIGAGGGSIAWLDEAGMLQLGPHSAGAMPGPACYGRGGTQATVTDANLLLGRIPAHARLAGHLPLDMTAARTAMEQLAAPLGMSVNDVAAGIIALAEAHMSGALRVVSVQRGYKPADFALICFGGAGGLHACALAESLHMNRVIVPRASGAFSALGMLLGRQQSELSQSRLLPLTTESMDEADHLFAQLQQQAQQRMPELQLGFERSVDLRYRGQGFQLTLPWHEEAASMQQAFEDLHQHMYGHRLQRPVEMITFRLRAMAEVLPFSLPRLAAASDMPTVIAVSSVEGQTDVPHFSRDDLRPGHRINGSALIVEATATVWLPSPWQLTVSEHGHLLLERQSCV